jgi:hypothetical protein
MQRAAVARHMRLQGERHDIGAPLRPSPHLGIDVGEPSAPAGERYARKRSDRFGLDHFPEIFDKHAPAMGAVEILHFDFPDSRPTDLGRIT